MMDLTGQVAVVTGGNQGIGRAIASKLADLGCRLAICARNAEKLQAVEQELSGRGVDVLAVPTDVSCESAVKDFFAAIRDRFGRVDILVNNAGAFDGGPIDELSLQAWNNVVGACLTGSFLCSREAFGMMKQQRSGRILNIGSISAQRPRAGSAPYASAKFGVWGLTQAIAIDGRPYGITCSCLHPGNVRVERRIDSELTSDAEPMMEMETIATPAASMLTMTAAANSLDATVLPRDQAYLARG